VTHNLGFQLFRAIERAKVQLSSERRRGSTTTRTGSTSPAAPARAVRGVLRAPPGELAACVDGLLARTGAEIDAVFLTGGSSYIPAVRRLFARRFGEERIHTADAFTSVVEGLGRAAASLATS